MEHFNESNFAAMGRNTYITEFTLISMTKRKLFDQRWLHFTFDNKGDFFRMGTFIDSTHMKL